MLVGPITIGDGAYTAAGSVITQDVPAGALAVARGQQRNIAGLGGPAPSGDEVRRVGCPGTTWTRNDRSARPGLTWLAASAHNGWQRALVRQQITGSPHVTGIQISGRKTLMLFSGRGYPELAQEVASELGTQPTPTTIRDFANGEIYVRFQESVRGCDAFVLQSHTASINKWMMETLIMIDALKRASAKRITVVAPFYPYARQDKKHRGREPISARLIADLFKTAGADRMMSVDLHTAQIQGFFDGPVDHLFALPLLADYVGREVRHQQRHHRGAGLRSGTGGRALDRPARRLPAGLHPQDARPAGGQPGRRQPRGRRRVRPGRPSWSTT